MEKRGRPESLEKDCSRIPKAIGGASPLATPQYHRPLFSALVFDLPQFGGVLVVGGASGDFSGRLSGAGLHYSSRLWAWLLLQIAQGQQIFWIHHRRADLHAFPTLAMGTRPPSCYFRRSG